MASPSYLWQWKTPATTSPLASTRNPVHHLGRQTKCYLISPIQRRTTCWWRNLICQANTVRTRWWCQDRASTITMAHRSVVLRVVGWSPSTKTAIASTVARARTTIHSTLIRSQREAKWSQLGTRVSITTPCLNSTILRSKRRPNKRRRNCRNIKISLFRSGASKTKEQRRCSRLDFKSVKETRKRI
jgi:hypothetical protein